MTMPAGFCVIYRWKLNPGKEDQFVAAWQTMTDEIRQHAGGLGSRLHGADDGTWRISCNEASWPLLATLLPSRWIPLVRYGTLRLERFS